ncbi:membrane protein [Gordonia phage LittleFella]|nr:membrane protein [Gordonia phage LittleFella]
MKPDDSDLKTLLIALGIFIGAMILIPTALALIGWAISGITGAPLY